MIQVKIDFYREGDLWCPTSFQNDTTEPFGFKLCHEKMRALFEIPDDVTHGTLVVETRYPGRKNDWKSFGFAKLPRDPKCDDFIRVRRSRKGKLEMLFVDPGVNKLVAIMGGEVFFAFAMWETRS